ncbi:MAG: transglutaminase family protein [Xanthobacteraceae bacterium]|jgi:transglutaminase-like putative cysteine protease
MRIRISHLTRYRYQRPATGVIQLLRLTPRNHEAQYVVRWRLETSADCRLDQHEDAFGNITHLFSADGLLRELSVLAEGEVETRDAQGIVRGTIERFPPSFYLRETVLTPCDTDISEFAAACRNESGSDLLDVLHGMLARLHETMIYDPDPTHAATTAAEAFALKRGVCQDLAHVFIAACRSLGIPARYVSGYFHRADGVTEQEAGHAWAEGHVPELGWVAFDPANAICATGAHVRVAVGLDYLDAAPLRGTRYGGTDELLSVSVNVHQASQQTQN